jgi:DNA (cytosine-5)-methyltransferase 1
MRRAPEVRLFEGEIIVDCFAGGGGASTGIEAALGRSPDIAINHDAQAVAMHRLNHPATKHYCEDIRDVDPRKAVGGHKVGLAWFSPDCTFHSKARGGKPFRDRNRARRVRGLAWIVVRWAEAVRPRVIMLENVEEFAAWGPLGTDGRPCPLRKGFTFRRWIARLQNLGYDVDIRELRACDYGAPTTRRRLFVIARCDGKPIIWPEATHAKGGARGLLPYRAAAECIDFGLPCPSIFLTKEEGLKVNAKRPLAENTMRRIARGLKKFVLDNPKPFIVPMQRDNRATGLGEPLQTITTQGNKFNLAVPYVAGLAHGEHDRGAGVRGCAMDDAVRTIQPGGNDQALVAPYLARIGQTGGNGDYSNDVREPATTVTSKAEHLLIAPIAVPRYGEREGQEPRALSLEQPHPTIVPTSNGAGLVSAFLAKHFGGHETPGSQMSLPMDTVTARDHHALVASSLLKMKGSGRGGANIEAPLLTIEAHGYHHAEVRAFLTKFYGDGGQLGDLHDPLATIRTKDCMGLVMVDGVPHAIVDIGMRMLKPRELYLCQGFPPGYRIDFAYNGKPLPNDAQVRMVGNSVSPVIPAAMVRANFAEQRAEAAA